MPSTIRTTATAPCKVLLTIACVMLLSSAGPAQQPTQQPISSRTVPILVVGGLRFRDLNRDGKLEPFEDWRLPVAVRTDDLLKRLTLEERAGLMMHGTAPAKGDPAVGRGEEYDPEKAIDLITTKHVTTFITRLGLPAQPFAVQNNRLQALAEQSRFAIPLTISTDPRNVFEATLGASTDVGYFTKWPGPLGLAAAGDPALTVRFADETRREYLAAGINEALSPQADLATEPRWPRIDGTFGEDAELASRMVHAFVAGFQDGESGLHPGSVACVVKHWVGYGAAKDGWDSHNIYGRFATFPGNNFLYHTIPFKGAFSAHVAAVMPTYSVLTNVKLEGRPLAPVGAGMNRTLLTTLLRDKFGFQGVVLSDWLITSDCVGECVDGAEAGKAPTIEPGKQGMSWGVEKLSVADRYRKAIEAGIDQFGGVSDTDIVVELVRSGRLPEDRVTESARRILLQKFEQGLFDNPFVDEDRAAKIIGNPTFLHDSLEAQHRSMVLLRNEKHLLPLPQNNARVVLYGLDAEAARAAGLVPVRMEEHPDAAIVRMHAPFQTLHPNYFFGSSQHEGDLDFKEDDPQFQEIKRLASKIPVIVSIYLDRPSVLTQLLPHTQAIVADFGATDEAIFDVLTGRASPEGHLPFELPSSMQAVRLQRSDVPHDSSQPLYPIFFGLTYPEKPER